MKKIALANGNGHALVDDDDFEKLSTYSWYKHSDGYVVTNASKDDGGGKIYMHRLVLGIRSNKVQVDHDNHNKLDNRKKNLKRGTQQQNLSNRRGYAPVGKDYLVNGQIVRLEVGKTYLINKRYLVTLKDK